MNTKIYALLGAAITVGLLAFAPYSQGPTHIESIASVQVTKVLPHYAQIKDADGQISTVRFHERCTPKANVQNQMFNVKTIVTTMNNGQVNIAIKRQDFYDQICVPSP